jgi:hypothetical protein
VPEEETVSRADELSDGYMEVIEEMVAALNTPAGEQTAKQSCRQASKRSRRRKPEVKQDRPASSTINQ